LEKLTFEMRIEQFWLIIKMYMFKISRLPKLPMFKIW
jgi:hypothetical protein